MKVKARKRGTSGENPGKIHRSKKGNGKQGKGTKGEPGDGCPSGNSN